MISKQASTLPRRLLRRYGTSVPFELADCLGITILECHDFKLQKGAFKVILNKGNFDFAHYVRCLSLLVKQLIYD